MSSSPEISTRTAGAHRAHREARDRGAARTVAERTPARYEPFLDGLFTYCLSVLCDHDAATAVLGDVLALAERRGTRAPDAAGERRAWLYALARWACLRRMADAQQKRQASHAAGRHGPRPRPAPPGPAVPQEVRERRRRELALLAWPEAAGTTPEQREALELAVRHHLAAHEVAAVLGMDQASARELLASAACEVERTRAVLAVVESGACPGVARLTGDSRFVLSSTLRRELVRHVDDCPRCRRAAQRAVPGRWPGATVTPEELPVLEAPRAALSPALAHRPRARGAAVPRFDRRGFPMDPKDRAARRDRLRARAVTTTVVATVVAAPVIALWSAYRGGPHEGEGESGGPGASATREHGPGDLDGGGGGYENAGNASTRPDTADTPGPDVSVEVVGVNGAGTRGPGQLEVSAATSGDTTLITLTASGEGPVSWSASAGASWLYLSRASGTLRPGESVTVRVYVDPLREPARAWQARVAVAPAGVVVTIEGYGTAPSPAAPEPRPGEEPSPARPTPTASASPAPSDPPESPEPTPSGSSPGAPASSPPPDDDGGGGDPSPSPSAS